MEWFAKVIDVVSALTVSSSTTSLRLPPNRLEDIFGEKIVIWKKEDLKNALLKVISSDRVK